MTLRTCERLAVTALALVVLILSGAASAQTLRCNPAWRCNSNVEFLPSPAELVGALGGALSPDTPDKPPKVKIDAKKHRAMSAELVLAPWVGPGSLTLEARVTLKGGGPPTVIDWQPVGQMPLPLLTGDRDRRDVTVEYRLPINGAEAAGEYGTTVELRVWDDEHGSGDADVLRQQVLVRLPEYLVLRITDARGTPALSFDLAQDVVAYVAAGSLSGTCSAKLRVWNSGRVY